MRIQWQSANLFYIIPSITIHVSFPLSSYHKKNKKKIKKKKKKTKRKERKKVSYCQRLKLMSEDKIASGPSLDFTCTGRDI
jgi:hypothetical protein